MPVYLFTFHASGSWMPDHPRGYTKRGEGYKPPDKRMARNYANRAKGNPSEFDDDIARLLIQELIESCAKINVHLHAGATEISHLHGLVSWKHSRDWQSVRTSLKTSLTRRLNQAANGVALSRGASRKRVRDRGHFDYLMKTYLPDHSGLAWYDDRGWVDSRKRR